MVVPPLWPCAGTGDGELWPDIDDRRPCSFTIGSVITNKQELSSETQGDHFLSYYTREYNYDWKGYIMPTKSPMCTPEIKCKHN